MQGAVVIVLEYAQGEELSTKYTQLSVEEIKVIMYKLIEVCSYFEKAGIVHRDLKPNNIMIGKNKTD